MSESVDVLLATYQGADYLEEQLESILTQTHPSLHLYVRDDGSTDQTIPILKKWASTYPQMITLIPSSENLGVKGNFSELMKHSQAPYIMFADQDDRWFPHKVEDSLEGLIGLERQYGQHIPLLVHSDLIVADQQLKEISPSFWKYAGLSPELTSLNRLLTQNTITGCTVLMNRCLADLAFPIPPEAIMHDWWIALVCACFGHIEPLSQATLYYRQHFKNDIGAKHYHLGAFLRQKIANTQQKGKVSSQTFKQAEAFLTRYCSELSSDQQELLQAYRELPRLPYFQQKIQIIKYQFYKQGFLRNLKDLLTTY